MAARNDGSQFDQSGSNSRLSVGGIQKSGSKRKRTKVNMTRSATLKQSSNKMYQDVMQNSNRSIGEIDPAEAQNDFNSQPGRGQRSMTVGNNKIHEQDREGGPGNAANVRTA